MPQVDEAGFLLTRIMRTEEAHSDPSRVDDEQAVFLRHRNRGLRPPLHRHTCGDPHAILTDPAGR